MKTYIEGDCPKCGLPLEVIELENGVVKGNKQYRCTCGYFHYYRTEECKKADKLEKGFPSNLKQIKFRLHRKKRLV